MQSYTNLYSEFILGQVEEIVMGKMVDVAFLRGKDSPAKCTPLSDLFSRILLQSDMKILEPLATSTSPSLSNR